MSAFLYLCGGLAALVYLAGVAVLIGQGAQPLPALSANPLWLLVFVAAFGLGRLVQLAEQMREGLRRLDGWKSPAESLIAVKGASALEVLEQIRDAVRGGRPADLRGVGGPAGQGPDRPRPAGAASGSLGVSRPGGGPGS